MDDVVIIAVTGEGEPGERWISWGPQCMPFMSNVPEKGRDPRRNAGGKKKKAFMAALISYVSNENKNRSRRGKG